MATEWSMNSDIYDILASIKNVQKRYIEDEDETTLSLGVFGFIADTEAKKIQTATIMAGHLGNEMFPVRANLTKNVIAHATYNGISNINAEPARMTATICIKIDDIDKYSDDNFFYLDAMCPIFIDEYEFHLDYDVKIRRKKLKDDSYSYSAQYITTDSNDEIISNPLSNITNPYLKQPFILTIGPDKYLGIQATIRQCTIEEITDSMVSSSIIENKTYTFQFDNQMAAFKIVCTDNGEETEITPYMYGSVIDPEEKNYCWYIFTGDNTVRITFDNKSYIPGLNSQIYIKTYTTLGTAGNFEYLGIDRTSEGLYIDIESDKYGYRNLNCYFVAVTDSEGGKDKKTKEELQKLIPKAAMARGSITTEKDLQNYFNLINTDVNRVVLKKKRDNQLERIWYAYLLLKDDYGNIIPSNTLNIKVSLDSLHIMVCEDGRYIIPAGTFMRLDPATMLAEPISDTKIPSSYSDEYFNSGYYYYVTMYNIVISTDPLYTAYYYTGFNYQSYFVYDYVNENCDVQFIANRFHFSRQIITKQSDYNISFSIAQSIVGADSELNYIETETVVKPDGTKETKEIKTENLKVIMVLYRDGAPYRWTECEYDWTRVDESSIGIYSYNVAIATDNMMDIANRLKIVGLKEAGSFNTLYGYIDSNTEVAIYTLARIPVDSSITYPRKDIDNIAPGYSDFTVTNIYKAVDGMNFFSNYTNITNTRIEVEKENKFNYIIHGVPCIGRHYLETDTEGSFVLEAIEERKAYIDYCLGLVENSMNIDFKFFNTYGPSMTYALEDKTTPVGSIDITMRFKLALRDSSDISTKNDIIESIKKVIENLNDIGDWHAPNLIRDIINEYDDRIRFLEFVGFNKFGADDQHIINVSDDNPAVVPEFINIRNYRDNETDKIVPNISIELV